MFSEDHPLSPRWVMIHVNGLPLASAFVAQTRGGYQFVGWDQERYLQAATLDAIRTANYLFILANMDPKAKKPNAPEPYPLPDDVKRTKVDKSNPFSQVFLSQRAAALKAKEEPSRGNATSPNASGHAEGNNPTATPTTGNESGEQSSKPSARRGAPQRWKRNSR